MPINVIKRRRFNETSALTATGGDHNVALSWAAYPGANSYRIERSDPSDTNTGYQTVASGITATSYTDNEQSFEYSSIVNSAYNSGSLILGMLYTYRVIPVISGADQTAIGPSSVRPTDGYVHPNWTTVNGSTRRDARNTGHWEHNVTTTSAVSSLSPGTYSDTIYTATVSLSAGTYTFNRCWLKNGMHTQANTGSLTMNDCTIGPPRGLGASNATYDKNGLVEAPYVMNQYYYRCMFFHGGSQIFYPEIVSDCFFVDMTASTLIADPHMDCIWVQSDGLTLERCLLEACTRGQSSILGPGVPSPGSVIRDNVFNGLSANGAMVVGTGTTQADNGFKRYGPGKSPMGFNSINLNGDINLAVNVLSGSHSGSFWCDDGSSV